MTANVTKSDQGWARFRTATGNGSRKRPAIAHRSHFLPTPGNGKGRNR